MPKLFGSSAEPKSFPSANLSQPSHKTIRSGLSRAVSLALWRWRSLWIICGIFVALTAALATLQPVGTRPVLVARTDLPLGAVITAQDIAVTNTVIDPALLGPPLPKAEVIGSKVAVPLSAGTLIRSSDLVVDSIFSSAPPGSVLTVVRIENSGILSYVTPGMKLDLLGSGQLADGTPSTVLAQQVVVVSVTTQGYSSANDPATPWAQDNPTGESTNTVLVATTSAQSKTLIAGAGWQGVHAVIVQ